MTAEPNWYDDPSVPNQLRYFDGTQWSSYTSPKYASEPEVAPTDIQTDHAVLMGGYTVFTDKTKGTLSLSGGQLGFIDETGRTVFDFSNNEINYITISYTIVRLNLKNGAKINVDLTGAPVKTALSRATLCAPATALGNMDLDSYNVGMDSWMQALKSQGFTTSEQRMKIVDKTPMWLLWVCAILAVPVLIVAVILLWNDIF